MKRFTQSILALLILLSAGTAKFAQSPASSTNTYIVQLAELPVASYAGGVPGLRATKPARGQKLDPNSPEVVAYVGYLNNRHSQILSSVGAADKVYDYDYSFNGFAAKLTPSQAKALKNVSGVIEVTKDELQSSDTASTPSFLGLDAPGGVWDQLGGTDRAGDGIIIGIIDSGIWPESLSFSDRTGTNGNASKDGKLDYLQIPGWHGKCTPGEQFNAAMCNLKLIGAQHFNAAWGGDAGLKFTRPWEFASVRDYNGHGTHTASTAGGNRGVLATGPTAALGSISGMAPHARIAAYKALWSSVDGAVASGFTSDLVAAIDQAVADGVDVINYSISGTTSNFLDPAEVAFLFAADANIFVAASAGNSGPNVSTVAHPSPWITTVAAGTHNRDGLGSVTLGNGVSHAGASMATAVGPAPFIDSTTAGLPGADPTFVALCYAASDNGGVPVLDPAKVAGKIVLCDRGVTGRISKSQAVKEAGGVGMILANVTPGTLNADFHFVPTLHVSDLTRVLLKAYLVLSGPTAKINQGTIVLTAPAPLTATFSSRGPLNAGGGDILKPDVIAPGQDILAAVSPPVNGGMNFNVYSGTSMSSPHVAGVAALLKQLRPTWSAMMIKSALMTSGSDVLDGPNTNPLIIFRQGGGHIQPNKAADPGLVYDNNINDWLAFLCGTSTGVDPAACAALGGSGFSFDRSDLNVPSIAIGDVYGVQTVTRRVTNVGRTPATYNATVSGMTGFTVSVTPSTLNIAPGQTKTYTVNFTRTTSTFNAYVGGQLAWSDGYHNVRIPIVTRPVALGAPTQVTGSGEPISYPVKFGYTGLFAATARGIVPAVQTSGTVTDDPADSFTPGGPGTVAFPLTIAAGTTYARFSLFDSHVTPPSDIDLYVFRGTTLVGASGGATSNEEVNLLSPAAGSYTVYVHGFAVSGSADFTLFSWLLGSSASGNMTVNAPASATLGTAGTINLTFSGLTDSTKYLGSVAYSGTAGLPNPTIVRVDIP